MKPSINWCAYVHHLYSIILDLGKNRLMNSLWKFNSSVPREVSLFGFLVIFWFLSLYSTFHEAMKQCFVQCGIAECPRVIMITSDTSYLQVSQTSQGQGTVLHKIFLTPGTSHKSRSSQATLISDLLATIKNFPLPRRVWSFVRTTHRTQGGTILNDDSFITAEGYKSEPAKQRGT